ncbi:MAG: system phosphocarrier protein Hpr [Firmicutes bacterium]|nr:system phosphocarrier protein Hpr [Bacillota bacterium]
MTERTLTLANATGLHARPATMLVQTANKFNGTNVFLKKGEKEVSGRSLLAILSLGAGAGETLTIRTDGPQEKEAMEALIALLEGGLGE